MANKKISELPLISALSGSGVGGSVIPVVVGGTTAQISAENFSRFMNAYAAQTGSANTFTANQTINANLSVTGTTAIGGNTTIGGTLVVAGRLTAEEFYTEITTASVIYSSGSTKFGDTSNDTHEFTGSIQIGGETLGNAGLNAFTASAGLQLSRIYQATASIQAQTASLLAFTASQDGRNFTLSQVTGSFRGEIGGLEAYSASLKAAAIVSSSTQVQNYDLFALNSNLYTSTGSIKGEIAGIEQYTASLKTAAIVSSSTQVQNYDLFALNSNLYISTGSIKGEIAGIEQYTASLKTAAIVSSSTQIQNYDVFALNSNLYNGTGSIKGEVAGIEAYTASLKAAAIVSSSTQIQNYDLFALNSNLYTSTGSLIGITNGLMAYTSSNETWKTGVRAEINGIEAWTASLDTLYATDAQLYQLYQATRSLELLSGSMIGITNGLMAYTSSNETWKTGVRGEVNGIEAYTSSLKAAISVSGTNVQIIGDLNVNKLNVQYISSSVLVTSGSNIFGDQSTDKHEFTGSVYLQNSLILGTEVLGNAGLNSSTASLIGITNGLMALTASMKNSTIVSSSNQLGEIAGLQAYTSSLKSVAIVSSSQQIQNYNTFAVTASNNTYYGENTFANKVTHTNGYIVLTQVSQSLNFVDDTAAAAGGVPLGGLYRNGNFIVIRIV